MISLRFDRSRTATPVRALLAVILAALVFAGTAALAASPLDEARAAGEIGERRDGYVGLSGKNPTAELKELVGEINTKRKAEYKKVAKKTGTRLREVSALAGERLIAEAPSGYFVQDADGEWIRKP